MLQFFGNAVHRLLNNTQLFFRIDLMLVEYFVRVGFAGVVMKNGWQPMSGGSMISYRRGLKPFQSYALRYKIDACDTNWNFMRFEFLDGDTVCAAGYMKGAVVGRGGLVPNAKSYAALGVPLLATALPASVQHWLNAEKDLMAAAW